MTCSKTTTVLRNRFSPSATELSVSSCLHRSLDLRFHEPFEADLGIACPPSQHELNTQAVEASPTPTKTNTLSLSGQTVKDQTFETSRIREEVPFEMNSRCLHKSKKKMIKLV